MNHPIESQSGPNRDWKAEVRENGDRREHKAAKLHQFQAASFHQPNQLLLVQAAFVVFSL
jgi:hypothetical protein